MIARSLRSILVMFWLSSALCASSMLAQKQAAREPSTGTGEVNLTAMSANVGESGSPVTIRILRWSADEERAAVVAALNPAAPVAAQAGPAGARGGAARGGRAAAGRGGRGGAREGRGDAGAAPNPTAALTAAIDKAPTVGFIWTRDVTGYAIKYALHASLPDGGERIILATDRRLGANTTAWTPVAPATVTDYEFTLIEIRLNAKGLGEGKSSLTTKVKIDDEAQAVVLDNYAATPAILQNVKR